jgi:hypothetical protein
MSRVVLGHDRRRRASGTAARVAIAPATVINAVVTAVAVVVVELVPSSAALDPGLSTAVTSRSPSRANLMQLTRFG